MFKKITAFILTVILIISSSAPGVFAADSVGARIKEYIVAPSQYTNSTVYGSDISGTLSGSAHTTSLGNFGGYVIYEFNNKIENSSSHRYGIDFIISGNSFDASSTTQEPGQVWVSQDGNDWYALAGSEHYEDETVWDYSVTYYNTGTTTSTYTDSLGESGSVGTKSPYPNKDIYTTVDFDENQLTLSGILLKKNLTPSTATGISTSFGYVDTLLSTKSDVPSNPYIENPEKNGSDGQFDISWAVDKNGMPVQLDCIKYVKVQTATFIDSGIFGEKSTEINEVHLVKDESITSSLTDVEITVNGQKVEFDDNNFCKLDEIENGINISVNADNANVYINNERTSEKKFYKSTQKGLVRIIVQSGDGEPQIFMLDISSATPETELEISENKLELTRFDSYQLTANFTDVVWSSSDESIAYVSESGKVFAIEKGTAIIKATSSSGQAAECKVTVLPDENEETVSVTFSATDSSIIIAPETLEVKAGTAKSYGYEVRSTDHNDQPVDGITVFDVIVAAHKKLYGESFTRSTAENYLVMENGFIMKSFGRSSSGCGFLVNNAMPNDGILNTFSGTYTGYACDTAVVNDNDDITFFYYQDTKYYSDMFAQFSLENYTVACGKNLKVNIKGYSLFEHGLEADNEKYLENLKNVDIYLYENGELTKLGTTNKKGSATLKFTEEGEYTLAAVRSDSDSEPPTVVAFAKVTVTAKKDILLIRIFKKLFDFFKNIFNF